MRKKTKTIQFQVADPCAENWEKMHSLPGGKFCDNCAKTVVDFTEMTDNELIRFFEKSNQQLCGRFRNDQLNKDLALPRVPNSFQKLKAIAAVVAGLLTWNIAPAQTILPQENISVVKKTKAQKDGKHKLEKPNADFLKNKLKGIVKDKNGNTLIGVNILLEKSKGTHTDINGKFELEIPNDWESFEVTFSYVGYETEVIEFEKKDILNGKNAEVKMVEKNYGLSAIEVFAKDKKTRCMVTTGLVAVSSIGLVNVSDESKKEQEKKKEISLPISDIYPNPFVEYVNVLLELKKDQPYLFHLYNANGQLIWAKTYDLAKGKQELRLDFSSVRMAQGNHFLRITDGSQELQTKKIIKVNTKGEKIVVNPIRQ